uniref:Carboxypeptidase O n=1 Tax=Molossus molossus TaxID=27622 RepID=A0A7J8FQK5_MOLMO|nr:carboxypeptidase O [Molossus molossus]
MKPLLGTLYLLRKLVPGGLGYASEKYAKIVTKHFLGMTCEMQPMYYLKISQPSNNPKKIIWMDCGIHARERIAPAFCQWFVKEVRFWRKSRSSHNNGTCFGTDLTRDFNASRCNASSGSSRDWARDIGIPFSYTFELRDSGTYGCALPESWIQATRKEAVEAVFSILDDVQKKYLSSNSAGKVTSTVVVLSQLMSFHSLF